MRILLSFIIILVVPALAFSATLYVPSQYSTIQAAIDVAVNGDTVLVDDGTYVENIDFKGKAITVVSQNGPEATVIDGGKGLSPTYGSVVYFTTGEGLDSVLEGFTLTNGYGSPIPPNYPNDFFAAGLYIQGASPTVKNNIITGNATKNDSSGGGIGCFEDANPLIIDNVICHNYSGATGGGIACAWDCDPTITHNRFFGNWADINGGAVACLWNSNAIIEDNSICGNHARAESGIIEEWGGGGIYCYECSPLISNNHIAYNTTNKQGGGIYCKYFSSPTIKNNLLAGNRAKKGGGLDCYNNCSLTIMNCTLFMNSASQNGGALACRNYSSMDIADSILWDNAAPAGSEIRIGTLGQPSTVTVSYCDLMGGQASCDVAIGCTLNWGLGMLDADPLIATGPSGFHYLGQVLAGQPADSPCVDAGSGLASGNGMDAFWTRTDGITDSGTVDMGFHYGPFLIPALQADNLRISENAGGEAVFLLLAGAGNANRNYILLGSITEFYPGTPLPGGKATLPLNWDFFTSVVIDLLNTPIFSKFMGLLDGTGSGSATFDTLGPIPGTAGLVMTFAYALNNPWDFVSNPVGIEIF